MNYKKKKTHKQQEPKQTKKRQKTPNKSFVNTGVYYSFKSGKKSEELFEK